MGNWKTHIINLLQKNVLIVNNYHIFCFECFGESKFNLPKEEYLSHIYKIYILELMGLFKVLSAIFLTAFVNAVTLTIHWNVCQ